jgi:fucose permease
MNSEIAYKNTSKNKLLPLTVALYLLNFINGLTATMIGPLIPVYMSQYKISISTSGLVIMVTGIGGIAALIASIGYSGRTGTPFLIRAVFGIYIISIFLIALKPGYMLLLTIFFFAGASIKLLDAILNTYISDLHPEKLGFYVNLLHASFGIGALSGPFLSNIFISLGINWNFVFLALAVLSTIIYVNYILVQRNVPIDNKFSKSAKIYDVFVLLKNRNIVILCLITFLYGGFAISTSTWMPTFMTQQMKSNIFVSIIPVSLLWVGIIAGRIFYSFLSVKFNMKYILFFSSLLGGVVFTVAIIVNKPVAYIIGLTIAGFLSSPVVPLSIATASSQNKSSTSLTSTVIILFVNFGSMIVPWILGIVADKIGFWLFMIFLASIPFLMAISIAFLSQPEKLK